MNGEVVGRSCSESSFLHVLQKYTCIFLFNFMYRESKFCKINVGVIEDLFLVLKTNSKFK